MQGWLVNVSTGATTDGATFATTLRNNSPLRPLLRRFGYSLRIVRNQQWHDHHDHGRPFTVAATDATQAALRHQRRYCASLHLERWLPVSATITNATVTLTGPTDAAFTASPSAATRSIIENYAEENGNFAQTTTVSNNAAIAVPAALKNAVDALAGFDAAVAGNTVTVTGKADGSNFTYQAVDYENLVHHQHVD